MQKIGKGQRRDYMLATASSIKGDGGEIFGSEDGRRQVHRDGEK